MPAKPGKVSMVWPPTGRTMEASAAAWEETYQPAGWVLAEPAPEPEPEEEDEAPRPRKRTRRAP